MSRGPQVAALDCQTVELGQKRLWIFQSQYCARLQINVTIAEIHRKDLSPSLKNHQHRPKADRHSGDQRGADMDRSKCETCGLVTWANESSCKRCGAFLNLSLTGSPSGGAPDLRVRLGGNLRREELRRDAFKKIKSGLAVSLLYVIGLALYALYGQCHGYEVRINPVALGSGLLPVAWSLAGVLQLITGVPFEELSKKWDGLTGSQRGAIGITVFVLGLTIVLAVGVLVVVIITGGWRRFRIVALSQLSPSGSGSGTGRFVLN